MSKLYKYPLGGVWSQNSRFGILTPIYYSEVIAGQSLNGSLRVKIISDSLIRAAMNRVFFDVFVFYIPFRVLWTGWQDFIAKKVGSVPTNSAAWVFNYERNTASGTLGTVWQRRCYNHVFNDVFRSTRQAEVGVDQNTEQTALTRGRSFQNVLRTNTPAPPDSTIDTSGATVTVDEIKLAQKEQKQNRLAYFFDNPSNQEYLQVLQRLGVNVGWEIDDMPRLIGQYHARASFETVVATGDTSTASPSGFFSGHLQCKFRQRLIPEHGIIGGYLVPRIEIGVKGLGDIPLSQKTDHNFYWVDGSRQEPPVVWSNRFVDGTNNTLGQVAPAWEDYRTPVSQMFAQLTSGMEPTDNYAIIGGKSSLDNNNAADELRDYTAKVDDDDFWRQFIVNAHVAVHTEVSGFQRSPVPPRQLSV